MNMETVAAPDKSRLPRRGLFGRAILFSNQHSHKGMPDFRRRLISTSPQPAFFNTSWYAIFRLLGLRTIGQTARRRDVLIVTALCLLIFLPTSRMIWSCCGRRRRLSIWFVMVTTFACAPRRSYSRALQFRKLWGHFSFNSSLSRCFVSRRRSSERHCSSLRPERYGTTISSRRRAATAFCYTPIAQLS